MKQLETVVHLLLLFFYRILCWIESSKEQHLFEFYLTTFEQSNVH